MGEISEPMMRALGYVSATDARHVLDAKFRSVHCRDGRRHTILGPESEAGPEIDDLLRTLGDWRDEEFALEDVVEVELVLEALAHLLDLIVGQAVTVSEEGLISSALE
jgi:hypothetical protein